MEKVLILLVVLGIGELGWTQTRVGPTVPLPVVVPLNWSFNCTTKRGIPSPEAIQSNSGKDNKQYVRRIGKKWIQQENRISKGWYYWNKPKINGYRQQMHSM